MVRQRSKYELRCPICRTEPLLAIYGVNERGELYVHVRIYKQQRIYAEIVATRGVVQIRCRECLRWHKVVIKQPGDEMTLQEDLPPSVVAAS